MDSKAWAHDELLEDLERAIGPSPFINVPLGSVWEGQNRLRAEKYKRCGNPEFDWRAPIKGVACQLADLVIIKPSYTRFCLSIYEVKATRSDFLSDIRTEKWRGYLAKCHRFYFATPVGVVKKEDIPDDAGWIVRGEKGWKILRGAPVREIEIDQEMLLSMLFVRQRRSRRSRGLELVDRAFRYGTEKDRARCIGKKAAKAYACYEDAQDLKQRYSRLIDEVRASLQKILGMTEEECPFPEFVLSAVAEDHVNLSLRRLVLREANRLIAERNQMGGDILT